MAGRSPTEPTPARPMSHRIAAVVVIYRPQPELLLGLLRALAGDVERIFLFLNSPLAPPLFEECGAAAYPTPLELLGNGANVGLGRAYNVAAGAARAGGCDLLVLFDQDSSPPPGMAGRLASALDEARRRFGSVAAVGARPVPPEPGPDDKYPFIGGGAGASETGLAEIAFVISSGSVIDLDAFAAVGPFREDFFIDGIDIEWCFRARARGFRTAMALSEWMPHRLGGGPVWIPLLNIPLTRQPQERVFTFARNQTAMMRLPHVPFWWKTRTAAWMALRAVVSLGFGRHGWEGPAIVRGILCGLRGRLGPPIGVRRRRGG